MKHINEILEALRTARENVQNAQDHLSVMLQSGDVVPIIECKEAQKVVDDIEKLCDQIWYLAMDLDEPRQLKHE